MDKNDNELLKLIPFLEKLVEMVCISVINLLIEFFLLKLDSITSLVALCCFLGIIQDADVDVKSLP